MGKTALDLALENMKETDNEFKFFYKLLSVKGIKIVSDSSGNNIKDLFLEKFGKLATLGQLGLGDGYTKIVRKMDTILEKK